MFSITRPIPQSTSSPTQVPYSSAPPPLFIIIVTALVLKFPLFQTAGRMAWYDPLQERKGGASKVQVPEIEALLERDGYLRDHEREIRRRYKGTFLEKTKDTFKFFFFG